jgi:dTDP-glucose 4,6-dehydratase
LEVECLVRMKKVRKEETGKCAWPVRFGGMTTSVVTGGAGFLGSNLCDYLLDKGHRVICVDNLETGSLENIAHARGDKFTFVPHDVVEPIHIDEDVDFVFHLAALASPVDYLRAPLASLKVGSYGTHNALGLAKWKRARFLISSTSEVYGDPEVHPQPETYWGNVNPVGPRSVYDEAKRFAEALTMAHHRQNGTDVGIARIFNTYGPRLRPDDGRVVSNFLLQALRGEPLTVYGDGSQTRSLCFVTDEVDGLIALLDASVTGPVNIGNPDECTVLELARTVVELTGSASEIVHLPLPTDDPTRRQPDITIARTVLGWEPVIGLREGLARTAVALAEEAGLARPPGGDTPTTDDHRVSETPGRGES